VLPASIIEIPSAWGPTKDLEKFLLILASQRQTPEVIEAREIALERLKVARTLNAGDNSGSAAEASPKDESNPFTPPSQD